MPILQSHKLWPWCLFLLWSAALGTGWRSACAQPIIVHLKNGDRISGRVVSENPDQLIVTNFFGRLVIPKNQIVERELPARAGTNAAPIQLSREKVLRAPAVETAPANEFAGPPISGPENYLAPPRSAAPPLLAGEPAPPSAVKPPSAAPSIGKLPGIKPAEPRGIMRLFSGWKGEINMGASLGYSTINRQTYTGTLKGTHVDGPFRNILDYDGTYGRTAGQISDNRMDGSWKLEYDITKRLLSYNEVGAGYDQIRDIHLQYDVGPGMGYRFVMLSNFVWKAETGANFQQERFSTVTDTRYSIRLDEDSWWQITPRVKWDQKVEFYPQLVAVGQYRAREESNLNYLLGKHLTLTMSVIDLYESLVPAGVSHNDLQVRSMLGYKF